MSNLLSTKPLTKVRFSITGDADNELDSNVAITNFDMFKNALPFPGGVYDSGLGTTDYSYKCNTCRNEKEACMGHEGHHRLNYPVKSPIFESDIIKWLNIICFKCGKIVIKDDKLAQFTSSNKLREVYNFIKSSNRRCVWCAMTTTGGNVGVDNAVITVQKTDVSNELTIGAAAEKLRQVRLTHIPIIIGLDIVHPSISSKSTKKCHLCETGIKGKFMKKKIKNAATKKKEEKDAQAALAAAIHQPSLEDKFNLANTVVTQANIADADLGIDITNAVDTDGTIDTALADDIDDALDDDTTTGAAEPKLSMAETDDILNIIENLHPHVKRNKADPFVYMAIYMDKDTILHEDKIYPHQIADIFSRISDDTVRSVNRDPLSHPSKLILTVIKIPPSAIRPDTRKFGGMRIGKNNELSTAIQYIIKKNLKIPIGFQVDNLKYLHDIEQLNSLYFDLIKGTSVASAKAASKQIVQQNKSIGNGLVGKKGLLRNKALGKRVYIMIRSTITCNPTLKIIELGVPITYAKNIQMEEILQPYNKDRLMVYFNNGRKKYPGCTMIKKKNIIGPFSIENIKDDFQFEFGDTIYRDIIDGDVLYYNRQPSLHFSSIGCHVVKINEDPRASTLEMNVITCPWYNADFDGDQMNAIVLSTAITRNEIKEMAGVENWFISFNNSATTIGQADDSLIGMFELTKDKVRFNKYHAMMCFNNATIMPTIDDKIYTGRDLVSKVLEDTPINFKRKSGYYKSEYAPFMKYSASEVDIAITNGQMTSGVLMKKEIGKEGKGSIFHKIYIDYGPMKTLDQIFNFQQLAINYIFQRGFSIGIDDMILNKKSLKRVRQIETNLVAESRLITDKLNASAITPPIGQTTEQFYEEQQINCLRVLDDFAEPILQSVNPDTNNLFKLILSGSKGKINNLYAIVGAIGQIQINGHRIDKKFGYERTLAYFQRFETSPESRGFITNSYVSGMTSPEFIFNSYAARFDLISKALSTSITGEKNRESVKNLESIIVDNLRMCRKDQRVIQFTYGEDNMDAQRVTEVTFPSVFCSTEVFEKKYRFMLAGVSTEKVSTAAKTTTTSVIITNEYKQLLIDRNEYQKIFLAIENRTFKELALDSKYMPVDVQKCLEDAIARNAKVTSDVKTVETMVTMVASFCESIKYFLMNDIQEKRKIKVLSYQEHTVRLFQTLVRSVLYSGALQAITISTLENILKEIKIRYKLALVEYGTSKGIIAAQAFSEPLTQYMLDAHKRSAEGGTSKDDIVKLKEILGAKPKEKISHLSMLLQLKGEYKYDKEKVQEVANHIEMMAMEQFLESTLIFIETINVIKHPKFIHESEMIKTFLKTNPLKKVPANLIGICIRMELNKTKLILKNMPLELIIYRLNVEFKHLFVVYTPENAASVVLRIYMTNDMFKGALNEKELHGIVASIKSIIIRGIDGISNTRVIPLIRNEIKPDGSVSRITNAWAIETDGSNIYGCAQNKYIDANAIITDSVDETNRMYGIAAAKNKIVTELREIGNSMTLNIRHFTLYASEMTYTGVITPISNPGVSMREPSNYLLRMGTSAPIQAVEAAALNTAVNKISGSTAPLLMGAVPKIGTLYNSFHINEAFIAANIKNYSKALDVL